MIKCYDTLTKKVVEVPVSIELETEIKRSYWREEHAERRYNARILEYSDAILVKRSRDIADTIIQNEEIALLLECLKDLSERERSIIYYKYYCNMRDVEIGKILGISNSYVGRLRKSICNRLKDDILSKYDYYV
ncbi:MAG: hypothetical protein IJE43_19140 [Alphaproteobacteria bacterium]|nr:hypothetical protein [Alphaproteobacteria bacterium]